MTDFAEFRFIMDEFRWRRQDIINAFPHYMCSASAELDNGDEMAKAD